MALVQVQSLLARLYTDADLREKFFVDPDQIAKEFCLSQTEVENFSQINHIQIKSFSVSLIQKRLSEVRKKLGLTSRLLGPRFPPLFFRFAQAKPGHGIRKHLEDCFAFADFLRSVARREGIPEWILEILRYEMMGLKTAYGRGLSLHVSFFKYAIQDLLIELLRKGNNSSQPKRKFTVGIWMRIFSNKRVWHKLF